MNTTVTMVDHNAGKFISSLVKSLQMVCHGCVDFNDSIEIIGHINLRIDNRQKFDYIVNEQVCKQGGESTFFQSNSYHSLPPAKYNGGERERQNSGKFDDDTNINHHHRLDDPLTTMGGPLVHVDLSGPVPVTRSTSAPSHDGYFSTAGSNRHRSLSRDSKLLSAEEEAPVAAPSHDHSFNHSSLVTSKTREQINREDMELTGNGGTTEDMNDASAVLAMYKDTSASRQQSHVQRQDVIIKPEPTDAYDSTRDDSGDATRISDALDVSATSTVLPAAHQSTLLATAAHTGHTMLAATTLGHPSFFDANLASQDEGETSRHTLMQQAIMQQIINAQKQAQHLALPDVDEELMHEHDGNFLSLDDVKPLSMLMARRPADCFHQPEHKDMQALRVKNWNHQVPPLLFPPKLEGLPKKTEKTKTKSDRSSVPSTSSTSGVREVDSKIKNALANKLAKRGRGQGSRKLDALSLSARRNRRLFHCSYCDYASVRRYNTERHIRLRHPTYRYKCPVEHCNQILLNESELRVHLQSHSGSNFFLQCQVCRIMCSDYDSLLTHQNNCSAVQRDGAASVPNSCDRQDHCEERDNDEKDSSAHEADSGLLRESSRGRRSQDDSANAGMSEHVDRQHNSETSAGHNIEHGNKIDEDDDSIEVVDDDNLPVHFMVKEEVTDSPVSSS